MAAFSFKATISIVAMLACIGCDRPSATTSAPGSTGYIGKVGKSHLLDLHLTWDQSIYDKKSRDAITLVSAYLIDKNPERLEERDSLAHWLATCTRKGLPGATEERVQVALQEEIRLIDGLLSSEREELEKDKYVSNYSRAFPTPEALEKRKQRIVNEPPDFALFGELTEANIIVAARILDASIDDGIDKEIEDYFALRQASSPDLPADVVRELDRRRILNERAHQVMRKEATRRIQQGDVEIVPKKFTGQVVEWLSYPK